LRGGVEDSDGTKIGTVNGDLGVLESKEILRKVLNEKRLRLGDDEVSSLSGLIAQNLFSLDSFLRADKIALYSPINNEVGTLLIFLRARECGKEVYYPRTQGTGLEFARVRDVTELIPGKYGVFVPPPNSEVLELDGLDLIVVPGVGFDRKGSRLGYGKGYYDRSISPVERGRRVGLAYGFQVVDFVPSGAGDEPVGMVVTERGVIFCEGGRG